MLTIALEEHLSWHIALMYSTLVPSPAEPVVAGSTVLQQGQRCLQHKPGGAWDQPFMPSARDWVQPHSLKTLRQRAPCIDLVCTLQLHFFQKEFCAN